MSVSLSTKGLIRRRAQIPAVIFLQTYLVLFFRVNVGPLLKIFYHLPRTNQRELSFSYIQTMFIGPQPISEIFQIRIYCILTSVNEPPEAVRFAKTNLYHFLHCYHQRRIRWLQRDLNLHLWISRLPLYPLSYRAIGDWWRVLSNLSGRNIFVTT